MITYYLILAVILFSVGIVGAISRRNIIIIYMSIELMLNAINIGFVALSNLYQDEAGNIMAIMIMAIAAAEAALFMAMFVVIFRDKQSLDASLFNLLSNNKEKLKKLGEEHAN